MCPFRLDMRALALTHKSFKVSLTNTTHTPNYNTTRSHSMKNLVQLFVCEEFV